MTGLIDVGLCVLITCVFMLFSFTHYLVPCVGFHSNKQGNRRHQTLPRCCPDIRLVFA